jgi:heme exporter protein A
VSEGIELRGLAQRFGRRWVLRGLDARVERGEVIALTGRNGSGKTTLLRICGTLLRPTRGTGSVFGLDFVQQAGAIRHKVGMLAHDAGLYATLTAEENLEFAQRMSGRSVDHRAIEGVLEKVGLGGHERERVGGFSAGMRRRLALARLLLRPPSLLLLDEPYASFDVDGIELVNAFTQAVARAGGIALIATHDLPRARFVLTRRLHIENGRFAEPGPVEAEASFAGAIDEDTGG